MTPFQFQQALQRSYLRSHKTIEGTRLVLVEGYTVADAARETGHHRQAISRALASLEMATKRLRGCPLNWACITVCVPIGGPSREVRNIERRELHRLQMHRGR